MTSPGQPFGQPQQHGYPAQSGYPQHPQPPYAQPPQPFVQQARPGNDGLRITAAVVNIAVAIYLAVVGVLTVDSVINMTDEDDDYISITGVVLRGTGALGYVAGAALLILGAVFLLRKRRAGSTLTWIGFAITILAFVLDSTGAVAWSMESLGRFPHLREKGLTYFLDSIRLTSVIAGMVVCLPLVTALLPPVKRALR
jgi:hypothetical protein